jgi:transposase
MRFWRTETGAYVLATALAVHILNAVMRRSKRQLDRAPAPLGHDARLMPTKYVRTYRKGQKNDFCDAEAIAAAAMRFVATKSADQLYLQALHRAGERLVGQRTGDGGSEHNVPNRSRIH